ncbi:MAG: hypothetical protein WD847_03750 [Pirellulales bacterium]
MQWTCRLIAMTAALLSWQLSALAQTGWADATDAFSESDGFGVETVGFLGHGHGHRHHRRPTHGGDCCPPPACAPSIGIGEAPLPPGVEDGRLPPTEPGEEPIAVEPAVPAVGALAGTFGAARGPESAAPNMLGDFLAGGAFAGGVSFNAFVSPDNENVFRISQPYTDGPVAVPFNFHQFKIADNESPWPRDRVFTTFNYYDDVGDDTSITRYVLGFERTIFDGYGSIGMRLPFFTVDPGTVANPFFEGGRVGTFGAGTNTQSDVGDLTIIFKYAHFMDRRGGDVFSYGLAVTAPTGPATYADVDPLFVLDNVDHDGTIQPFASFYRSMGRRGWDGWFLHGFSSLDIPFDGDDTTLWYNDLGLGYYMRRNPRRGLNAIIPTMELHVNSPLGNRVHDVRPTPRLNQLSDLGPTSLFGGFTGATGQVEYHNQVNMTGGLTMLFNRRTALAVGMVVPMAGPNPYDYEVQVQLNLFRGPWGLR